MISCCRLAFQASICCCQEGLRGFVGGDLRVHAGELLGQPRAHRRLPASSAGPVWSAKIGLRLRYSGRRWRRGRRSCWSPRSRYVERAEHAVAVMIQWPLAPLPSANIASTAIGPVGERAGELVGIDAQRAVAIGADADIGERGRRAAAIRRDQLGQRQLAERARSATSPRYRCDSAPVDGIGRRLHHARCNWL